MTRNREGFASKYLENRGGSWGNYLRRFNWYVLPAVFVHWLILGFAGIESGYQTSFFKFIVFPLSVIGGLWFMSQTLASSSSCAEGDRKLLLADTSYHLSVAGVYLIPISFSVFSVWSLTQSPITWYTLIPALAYLPSLFGSALNFVDMMNSLHYVQDNLIKLGLFNKVKK
jgi:hypothetical protein